MRGNDSISDDGAMVVVEIPCDSISCVFVGMLRILCVVIFWMFVNMYAIVIVLWLVFGYEGSFML